MSVQIKIILPLPPSVNRLWRTGRNGVYRSPKYTEWRTPALWQASIQAKGKVVDGPYKLTLLAVKPDKRRRDLDNLFKAASDVLQSAGVITDDSNCNWIEAKWVKSGPQCTLIIEAIEEEANGEEKRV
jgi:crossover junction endodeoxyribonuclease RusA